MKTPLFSIIIPIYNGHNVIERALNSIYSQGITLEDFEVICVDDCSPTMDSVDTINNYIWLDIHPTNLKIIRHEVNKRQGGARNSGVKAACGQWIIYLDQDDMLVENSLLQLKDKELFICNHDLIMLSHRIEDITKNTLVKDVYKNITNTKNMSGCEYLLNNPIGWAPWCYIYNRDFLLKNKLFFEENVRWEDLDYVMKALLYASKMSFIPIEIYHYILEGQNTSFMRNDKDKIKDWFKMSIRVKKVAEDFIKINKDSAWVVMKHHIFHYSTAVKKTLWSLRYSDIYKILVEYKPYEKSGDKYLNFVIKHPRLYAAIAQFIRPILILGLWIRNKIRK